MGTFISSFYLFPFSCSPPIIAALDANASPSLLLIVSSQTIILRSLRSLSTSTLLPQHVAIADMLLSDTTMSPTTTCCPRRHVSLADMLPPHVAKDSILQDTSPPPSLCPSP